MINWRIEWSLFVYCWIPFTEGCFVPNLVEIGPVSLVKKFFLNFLNEFSLFHNYLPLEMGVAFIWTNLNLHYSNMLCAKYGWNWPSVSGEEDFKISSTYFRYFVIIDPSKWARSSFEQTWIPVTQGSPKDASCQVCLKLT